MCAHKLVDVVLLFKSAGKSSVLESIVGHSFLPSGTGIVTRCPLKITLKHVAAAAASASFGGGDGARRNEEAAFMEQAPLDEGEEPNDMWAVFSDHQTDRCFTSYAAIRKEIMQISQRICGETNNGVSSTPIHLTINSPRVPDLNLIDLPGIINVAGDNQPKEIVVG